jgi:hypothetical protein
VAVDSRGPRAVGFPAEASMLNTAAALAFAGFVAAGLILLRPPRAAAADPRSRRRVSLFLLYVLLVSFGAGLSQHDLWPFAHWPIVSLFARPGLEIPEVRAVDARGQEHALDYRALQPLGLDDLQPWLLIHFPTLKPPAQARAAAHLLALVEDARQRARRGGRVGRFERAWGPLTAPYFLLHPKRWRTPADTPAEPFEKLRLYRVIWIKGVGITGRELDYEYPSP